MKTRIAAALILTAAFARAEIVRWPMKIVETSYTVHRMTGLTSNEKAKEKLTTVVVDVSKVTRDGEALVEFVRKTKLTEETASATSRATIPAVELPAMLEAITKARQTMMRPGSPDDSEETLFEAGEVDVVLINQKRKRWVEVSFYDQSEFVLHGAHVQQLQSALRKLK